MLITSKMTRWKNDIPKKFAGSYVIYAIAAVTRHPIQAEDDGDMEKVLIVPVFKGDGGLPNSGLESINSSCKLNFCIGI